MIIKIGKRPVLEVPNVLKITKNVIKEMIHHSKTFWVGALFCLAAFGLIIYWAFGGTYDIVPFIGLTAVYLFAAVREQGIMYDKIKYLKKVLNEHKIPHDESKR